VRKKLIEVALPLEAINKASAREKSIRHGHPSTLHLWWARRPLAACRAVLFASLVDDPSSRPEEFPTEKAQAAERRRLFKIIEEMVLWENTNNERVMEAARKEILKSTDGKPPPVLDPFCGGGSIPLEAQRLGLKAYASDLNPVAVLITKALIEIPPKFAGRPPVNPEYRELIDEEKASRTWKGAAGLAEDVRYYGKWMRDEAEKRIGHLYPKVRLPKKDGGGEATVIAWLWARTVKCPNPACGARMPLVRSFWLSTKKGKQAWVKPVVDRKARNVRFEVKSGKGTPQDGTVKRNAARCLVCGEAHPLKTIRERVKARGPSAFGVLPLAVVTEGDRRRVYVSAPDDSPPKVKHPTWLDEAPLPKKLTGGAVMGWGFKNFGQLFTPRQLVALTTFSDLVGEARKRVLADAIKAGLPGDDEGIDSSGTGATAYADAVATYLAFAVDKGANYWSSLCAWHVSAEKMVSTFARQALPMVWDYTEANPFCSSSGNFMLGVEQAAKCVVTAPAQGSGFASQLDAIVCSSAQTVAVSTDPPYYDNIGYSDISDFFYVWLRRALSNVYPDLFSTLLTPKAPELVAVAHRFGGDKAKAEEHFEEGLQKTFANLRAQTHPECPVTVYYAFKQSETDNDAEGGGMAVASTGWETMLEGLLVAGFSITGTWPVRTELTTNLKKNVNALASSIVLVCRPRPDSAPMATRREFVNALKKEMPPALAKLQQGNIAPVDLAQASIGPGIAVFSRYAKILEADGKPMSVRTALQIINQHLDEYLAEQEGDLDADTRFCVTWFSQYGTAEGPFGEADVLARAKNTSVGGLVDAGVLHSRAGKVRLRKRGEYDADWDPAEDERLTVWECTQHLIRALEARGEEGAARLCARLGGGKSEEARALAYRLYSLCERKGWADQALAYNTLVVSWPAIQEKAASVTIKAETGELF